MEFFRAAKTYRDTAAQDSVLRSARGWRQVPIPYRLERHAQLLFERGELRQLERLLIDPEYVYRAALAMPDRRDFFRLQVMALRHRRKFSAEVKFKLILANRFFESIAVTALPSGASDAWYGELAWQARGLDFHQKFLVMLVVYCKKVERKEEDTTLKFRLLSYLQGQERIDRIPFQEEYSSISNPSKAQVRGSDFKEILRWSMPRLAEEADMLSMLVRFVGFPEAIAWIANSDFTSLDAVRPILEAAGHQQLLGFRKADSRHQTYAWDEINVESLVSLVEIMLLYHRLGLGALIITGENLAYFESELARAYNGKEKTIAWPHRRRHLGEDERVIVRCVVTDPLISTEFSDLMGQLLPRIKSACPGTGEQRHQVAVRSLFENGSMEEGASLEAAFMDLKKTPLWGEVLNPLWLLQNIRFIEGRQLRFKDARSLLGVTPQRFFVHRITWAIELTLRQLAAFRLRVSKWRSSDERLNPLSLRDSAMQYLWGRPEALAFFLARANHSLHRGRTGTIESYRDELLRFQRWMHSMPTPKVRKFICENFKIGDRFIHPPKISSLATLRTLLFIRRYLRSRVGTTALSFQQFVRLSYMLAYGRPALFEWLWPRTFAYYIDDLTTYLEDRRSLGMRFLGAHYACWLWRVSFYVADRLFLSRRSYEDFVQERFKSEFYAGSGEQNSYLPRDAVPGFTATMSGRRWPFWTAALLSLVILATYVDFVHSSAIYTFRDAFQPAPLRSYLISMLDRVMTFRADPGLILAAVHTGARQIGRGGLEGVSSFPWAWTNSDAKGAMEKVGLLLGSLVAFGVSSWGIGHLCIWLASVTPFTTEQLDDKDYIAAAIGLVVGLIGVIWLVFLWVKLL